MDWNYSAASFLISGAIGVILDLQSLRAWRKQPENRVAYNFFMAIAFFSIYFLYRGFAALVFTTNDQALAAVYVSSHIAIAFFIAYWLNMSIAGINPRLRTPWFFIGVLVLMTIDITLNIKYPNNPHFSAFDNVVEWGANPFIGKIHSIAVGIPLMGSLGIFIYQVVKYWHDAELRIKTLAILAAMMVGFLVTAARDLFPSALGVLASDLGFVFMMLIGAIFIPSYGSATIASHHYELEQV